MCYSFLKKIPKKKCDFNVERLDIDPVEVFVDNNFPILGQQNPSNYENIDAIIVTVGEDDINYFTSDYTFLDASVTCTFAITLAIVVNAHG